MLRTASIALLWALPASAQAVPEAPEPNDTTATATALALGREAFGTLATTADSDWFRLTLTAATDLRLESGPGVGSQVADTVLTLLDAAGAPVRSNDQGVQAGYYARLEVNGLAAGTYYVAVECGTAAVAPGSYTLDVRGALPVAPGVPPLFAEGPENNDPRTGGTATGIVLPARCDGVVSSSGAGGDWDFYRFTLATESFVALRVAATASHPSPRLDDPVLYLFDANVPPMLLAGPAYASAFGSWDTALQARLLPGSYHVAIRGFDDAITGGYFLDVLRSDGARITVHPGGCGGRVASVATTNSGPGAPLRSERPTIGTSYALRGSSLGAGGFAFHAIGFSPTFLDLSAYGAPGCILEVNYVDAPLQLADASGNATFVTPVPESPSLLGLSLESQIAVLDLSNPLGITLSNRVSAELGN